ncbi:DLW-39 family protein [uncultured Aeromicrobium sp.]|nr:DLW-39 family protein [uncultured Aeromicrobium sp.]
MKKLLIIVAAGAGAFALLRRRSARQDPWAQASDRV